MMPSFALKAPLNWQGRVLRQSSPLIARRNINLLNIKYCGANKWRSLAGSWDVLTYLEAAREDWRVWQLSGLASWHLVSDSPPLPPISLNWKSQTISASLIQFSENKELLLSVGIRNIFQPKMTRKEVSSQPSLTSFLPPLLGNLLFYDDNLS